VPIRSMHADSLPIPDQAGGVLHANDGRQEVFSGDHRVMDHQSLHVRHRALDRNEQRRPAGVRVGGDQDVARFEIRLRQVQDDAGGGPALSGNANSDAARSAPIVLSPGRAWTL
jgi:hypothetical protein